MSLETAQKVIVPQKKNYVPHFLKQRDINSYFLTEHFFIFLVPIAKCPATWAGRRAGSHVSMSLGTTGDRRRGTTACPVVLYHHNSPCKKMYNKGPPPSAWAGLLNKPFSHFEKKRAFYFQF
jgi:hypothetical protein